MIDLRPTGYILGLVTAVLGAMMVLPMVADLLADDPNWTSFLASSLVTSLTGALVALACANGAGASLDRHDAFILTTAVWLTLPFFGALPFMLGAPHAVFADAYFEAVSGMTTTGTTVFVGLDSLPPGVLLWRSILQWLGGLGIVIVALLFLPVMRVGGMQFFQSEAFDTMGKVLPRALDISRALVEVYVALTLACMVCYFALGMSGFDALNHAMTTIATGGYSTTDASFAVFPNQIQWAATVFMLLAGLPFVRYVQLMGGSLRPLLSDLQVRAYLRWSLYGVAAVTIYRMVSNGIPFGDAARESAFNVVSLWSGTGYTTDNLAVWGAFPLVVVIIGGLIGACTASTGCSIKLFRYLVMFEAVKAQLRGILTPNRVVPLRLGGRPLEADVINSVIALFTLFLTTLGLVSVLLSLSGMETRTAVTAAWTSILNIGPAYGPEVSASGAVDGFSPFAKWTMIVAMLLGRLELLSVLVLLVPRFWHR